MPPQPKQTPGWHFALAVSVGYAALAALWILGSDWALELLTTDPVMLSNLQSWKGLAFVAFTSLLLYFLILHRPEDDSRALQGKVAGNERRVHLLIASGVCAITALMLANLAYTLAAHRQATLADIEVKARNLSRVTEEQARGAIDAVDVALASIAREAQLLPAAREPRNPAFHALLLAHLEHLAFVRAIWVLDREGNMIHDSDNLSGKYNLSDREYFRALRDRPRANLFLDLPIRSKLGVWFLAASRRIENPDGGFEGVVTAAIEPRAFERFYQSIDAGETGIIGLARTDGMLIARVPVAEARRAEKIDAFPEFMQKISSSGSGSFRSASTVDGIERIVSFRRITDRPLFVFIGLGVKEGLVRWQQTMLANVLAASALVLIIAWLGYLSLSELRRQRVLNDALRAAEEQFRTIFEQAGIGIAMVSFEDGRIMRSNQALAEMLGYSVDELTGRTVEAVSEPEDYTKDRELWQSMVEGARLRFQLVKRYRRKDGSLMWGMLTSTLVRAADSTPLFIIGMLENITESKRAQEAVVRLSDRLLSVQETERGVLARELHDEFGQVLTAVKLQLQSQLKKSPSPRLEDSVALIDELLRQVRSLSLDLRPAQLDEEGLAVALQSHIARLSRHTGRAIGFECGPDVPMLTGAHATACFRVVQEAVTNALRHSRADAILVRLERDGDFFCMTVRDNGAGFDAASARTGASLRGSMGLLGMEDRLGLIGGTLEIRSAAGAGTEVRARVPMKAMLGGRA